MDAASRKDPYLAFRFSVEIDGMESPIAGFSEVSNLTIESELETFHEGGVNDYEHQLPGPIKFASRLVLKRGMGDITSLWKWYHGVMKGQIVRRNIKIKLCDNEDHARRSWIFRDACPIKWSGPELRAGTTAIAFESIELVHRGLL